MNAAATVTVPVPRLLAGEAYRLAADLARVLASDLTPHHTALLDRVASAASAGVPVSLEDERDLHTLALARCAPADLRERVACPIEGGCLNALVQSRTESRDLRQALRSIAPDAEERVPGAGTRLDATPDDADRVHGLEWLRWADAIVEKAVRETREGAGDAR